MATRRSSCPSTNKIKTARYDGIALQQWMLSRNVVELRNDPFSSSATIGDHEVPINIDIKIGPDSKSNEHASS